MISELLHNADGIARLILGLLTCMSICTWGFFIYKVRYFYKQKKSAQRALGKLETIFYLRDITQLAVTNHTSLAGHLMNEVASQVKCMQKNNIHSDRLVTICLEDCIDRFSIREKRFLSFFKVVAESAPLIGLFGTVWGLIHAFFRIGQLKSADIAVVAPGVSEALITTLMGLAVAIPALGMYYVLVSQRDQLESGLISMSQRLEWITKREDV